jgi:fructose-bisphosphate aldolase class I
MDKWRPTGIRAAGLCWNRTVAKGKTMQNEMAATVQQLTAPGKGLLAADESDRTIAKRFQSVNLESTEETHRRYRDMLFTTPGFNEYISGVILYAETIHQNASNGAPFAKLLADMGVVPGIKVDKGTLDMCNFPGETVTRGLDTLNEMLAECKALGARFAKWRAVIHIAPGLPTTRALQENATLLARYAATCQAHGIVPIVEPEVLMDGAHDLATCAQVTETTLTTVFYALHLQKVSLEHMILKPSMVIPGKESGQTASPEEVANATLACLRRTVPAAVPGIFFLSGGQTPEQATANLNAINLHMERKPWVVSFSYARALQMPALELWRGNDQERQAAQRVFYQRARLNSLAALGKYTPDMEKVC